MAWSAQSIAPTILNRPASNPNSFGELLARILGQNTNPTRRALDTSFAIRPTQTPAVPAATQTATAPRGGGGGGRNKGGPANVTDLSLVAANHLRPSATPAGATPTMTTSGNIPSWLSTGNVGNTSNLFGNTNTDLMGLLSQILGGGGGAGRQAAPAVDPNQSELFRQQAEQIRLSNDMARAQRQGQIDMANLVNARNRFPSSNIGSLTYGGSPAESIDKQISALNANGGYSTGWYGSMWPRTPWT